MTRLKAKAALSCGAVLYMVYKAVLTIETARNVLYCGSAVIPAVLFIMLNRVIQTTKSN